MTDASPISPATDKDLAGQKIVAAVTFARTIIESIWDGEIADPETCANIQATAQDLGLTMIREPTAEERADPEWWGHGNVGKNQLIECFDPAFASIVDHLDEAEKDSIHD
jgi:hypothetical protein